MIKENKFLKDLRTKGGDKHITCKKCFGEPTKRGSVFRSIFNMLVKMKDINYHIEENFISSEECQKLINEAKENLEYSDFIKIHSNRNILNSSSLGFHKLLQKSKVEETEKQNRV